MMINLINKCKEKYSEIEKIASGNVKIEFSNLMLALALVLTLTLALALTLGLALTIDTKRMPTNPKSQAKGSKGLHA